VTTAQTNARTHSGSVNREEMMEFGKFMNSKFDDEKLQKLMDQVMAKCWVSASACLLLFSRLFFIIFDRQRVEECCVCAVQFMATSDGAVFAIKEEA